MNLQPMQSPENLILDHDSLTRLNALVEALPAEIGQWFNSPGVAVSPDGSTLTVFCGPTQPVGTSFEECQFSLLEKAEEFGFTLVKLVLKPDANCPPIRMDLSPYVAQFKKIVRAVDTLPHLGSFQEKFELLPEETKLKAYQLIAKARRDSRVSEP